MFKNICSVLLIAGALFSCQQKPEPAMNKSPSELTMKKLASDQPGIKEVSFTASVNYMKLEGGFYGLVTKEGQHWLPMNLPNEFKKHGAMVKVKGHEIKDIMTIQQWGKPFSITDIQLIKMTEKGEKNNRS
jgi:hypothetical protein